VNLMLLPTTPGPRTATLKVAEGGYGATEATASLSGFGGDPSLTPAPAGAHSNPVVVGQMGEPMSFTVSNAAFNPVDVKTVSIAGSDPADFAVINDQCSRKHLDAAATCTLDVVFTPKAAGRRTASVMLNTTTGPYATILVSGDAHYEPKLAVATTTVLAPNRVVVIGSGFAPNSTVSVGWADGSGRPITATTDAAGNLLASFLVLSGDRAGQRTIVAQTADGLYASADLQVVSPARPRRPGGPTWPHR
jgi:hypothetical protein